MEAPKIDRVVVGGTFKKAVFYRPKAQLVSALTCVIIVILLIILLVYLAIKKPESKITVLPSTCTSADGGKLLKRAVGDIGTNNTVDLSKVVERIQNFKDYQYDPDCLFILSDYYVNTGDMTNAEVYISKFYAVDKNGTLNPQLAVFTPPADLRERASNYQAAFKETEHNAIPIR